MVALGGTLCTAASNTAHCFAVSCTSLPRGKHERQTRSTWHPFAYFWSLSNLLVSTAEQRATVVLENPGKSKKTKQNGVDDALFSLLQKRKQSKGKKVRGNGGLTLPLLLGTEVSVQRDGRKHRKRKDAALAMATMIPLLQSSAPKQSLRVSLKMSKGPPHSSKMAGNTAAQ